VTPESVLEIGRQALVVTLELAAPPLLAVLAIGLLVSVLQAATQINEATLSFVPKLVGLALALALGGPWMLATLLDYTRRLFEALPFVAG
jgi:flagellar biosynthetic protein FliQ